MMSVRYNGMKIKELTPEYVTAQWGGKAVGSNSVTREKYSVEAKSGTVSIESKKSGELHDFTVELSYKEY